MPFLQSGEEVLVPGRRLFHASDSPVRNGGGNSPVVISYGLDSFNQEITEETSTTVRTNGGGDSTTKVLVIYGTEPESNFL